MAGDPEPQVYWTKQYQLPAASSSSSSSQRQLRQHQFLAASRRYDWIVENGVVERRLISTVHLTSAIRSLHAGQYRCTAVNLAGRAEVVYTVIVVDASSSSHDLDHDSSSSTKWRLTSWDVGRAVAVFGSTLLVLAVALTVFVVVYRHRSLMTMLMSNRYRVRDVNGSRSTSGTSSSKFAGRRVRAATLFQHNYFRHQHSSALSFQRQRGCDDLLRTNAWNGGLDSNGGIIFLDSLTATSSMSVVATASGKSTAGTVTYRTSVTLIPDGRTMQSSSLTKSRSSCLYRQNEITNANVGQRRTLTPIAEMPAENDADVP